MKWLIGVMAVLALALAGLFFWAWHAYGLENAVNAVLLPAAVSCVVTLLICRT